MEIKNIIVPIAPLKSSCHHNSYQETQCLYGEEVEILNVNKNWSFCRTKIDNYRGWIENKFLNNLPNFTHVISTLSTFIYEKPDYKSKNLNTLFLNSKIKVLDMDETWAKINFQEKKIGYIFVKHISSGFKKQNNWINLAKEFVSSPYSWGGKTCKGIDCSGLVQSCLQYVDFPFPRNSVDQQKFNSPSITDISYIEKGSLIFWKGHVAIGISDKKIIHSNIFHMSVKIESFDDANKRLKDICGNVLCIRQLNIK